MKSIVKCFTKSKKLLTLSFNEHVFLKNNWWAKLDYMFNVPTYVIIEKYSQWGHSFSGIENYVSKKYRISYIGCWIKITVELIL
jgi:hypothetical protein